MCFPVDVITVELDNSIGVRVDVYEKRVVVVFVDVSVDVKNGVGEVLDVAISGGAVSLS
ncbi:hypothetical protein DPMN_054577 [Dreissena polymorpha]|uniref:Uncharacterized protein n=1 Tax=Dreissena polymorpha TaxID=45954 RepID=A0A9D4CQL9_DREPO|nr:hypothetical protein DPMN_054577 [Dreissena polymorpha]